MSRTHFKTHILLQTILAEQFASFLCQRSFSYASAGELTNYSHQNSFRYERGS
jgi:hypothetical protein